MERQFNNGDFEKLLRDNANQYRMYPSEKVWKGVHAALHTRLKWYGISALAMLLLTGAIISLFVLNNKTDKPVTTETKKPSSTANTQIQSPEPFAEKDNLQISKVITPDKFTHEITKPGTSDITDIVPDADNSVSSETNANVTNNFQIEKVNDKIQIFETSTIEKQTLPVDPVNIPFEKINENSLDENTEEKINTDAKITDAISLLASQNAPIVVSEKQPRLTAQVYFTPTVSYRKLIENKRSYLNGLYINSQVIDLNSLVNHKPLMGLEFGIEGKFRVNDRFFIKSGFQFNINRYDISAYSHSTEIATVAINSGYRTDSLASLSNYRNFSGTNQNWLENFYFQAAVPIGAEIILIKKKSFNWGISGTVQPTYVIGDRAYLISSDYKNYAKFPDLMRRWNLSTGLETFVSYSTGKIKWQAGPHVRYQHLSSFVSGYPVKENLFAIGLKVGATINKKK